MNVYTEHDRCFGCGACANACPTGALRMAAEDGGFLYPQADAALCTGCGLCRAACPLGQGPAEGAGSAYYIARCREDAVRFSSSSGGIFPLLAEAVLSGGGAVFGAALGPGMVLRHRRAESTDELAALKKTKYVQSDTGLSLRETKELLEAGRRVLFAGTPCQTDGLLRYLGRPYEGLLAVDLVCYGAPSPAAWARHVKKLERGGPLSSFDFRDKRAGDEGHTVSWRAGGREHSRPLSEDEYLRRYFRNEIIRPSCFRCPYCTPDRRSDITLGDFWGRTELKETLRDGMGTSIVITHTPRGAAAWEAVRGRTECLPCSRADVMQPRLECPVTPPPRPGGIMGLIKARLEKQNKHKGG